MSLFDKDEAEVKENPAFPSEDGDYYYYGLSKREYFAIKIYAAMNSIPESASGRKMSADVAVQCTDALINALVKK